MPVTTYYNIAKKSFLVCGANVVVRAFSLLCHQAYKDKRKTDFAAYQPTTYTTNTTYTTFSMLPLQHLCCLCCQSCLGCLCSWG